MSGYIKLGYLGQVMSGKARFRLGHVSSGYFMLGHYKSG